VSTPAAMATHDASSPRGFYSAEADEDRVWSRERPELEKPPGRFRAADLAGKIPRPESRCASGTVWSSARASCISAAGIGAGSSSNASSSNGSGGFDFWAHFPAVLSLLLAFAVCVVVVVASLLGAFALARFGSRILARGARGTKKIATRLEEEMAKKAKEEKDPHRARRARVAGTAAAALGAIAEILAFAFAWIHSQLDETYARHASRIASSPTHKPNGPDVTTDGPDHEPPSGVKLGAIMGAALAKHAGGGRNGTMTSAMTSGEVESCAREMATGLAGYLERGRSAKEFVRAFVGACELAWIEGTAGQDTKGGEEVSSKDAPRRAGKGSRSSGETPDTPSRGARSSSPHGASTSSASDDEPMRPVGSKDDTDEGSPVGGWFQGLAKTWETITTPPAEENGGPKHGTSDASPHRRKRVVEKKLEREWDESEGEGSAPTSPDKGGIPGWGLAFPGRGGSPRRAMTSIMQVAATADDKQLKVLDMAVRMREVLSSERANDIAEKRLDLSHRALEAQRLNLNHMADANELHSEANTIAKSSLERKDTAIRKAEEAKALGETRAALADAFYAGLVVVLCTTLAGGWRRAMAALDSVIGVCPRPASNGISGAAWSYMGGGPGPLDYAWCVTRAFVKAAWGALVLLFVGWKLLQYNVVTNYQSAPAFVLLVVLGGGCGQLGRNAVDSLGGDGDLWLRMWGGYILLATMSTWRADAVSRACVKMGPVGRLFFFGAFGAAVPFAVGAAPFEDTFGAFAEQLVDRAVFWGEAAVRATEDAADIIGFGFLWSKSR